MEILQVVIRGELQRGILTTKKKIKHNNMRYADNATIVASTIA